MNLGFKEGYLEVNEPLEIIGKSDVCTYLPLRERVGLNLPKTITL